MKVHRSLVAALGSLALLAALLPAPAVAVSPHASAAGFTEGGVFIVQMVDDPVVAYDGGVAGLKATAPKPGQKIDPYSTDVVRYVGYLDSRHAAALRSVGASGKLYDYRYSYNGFAARLTAAQANKLALSGDVVAITPQELLHQDTVSTPSFLGLSAPGGFWDQLGGVGNAGEGIIVGDVDSGIWPENPSFSDRTGTNGNDSQSGKLSYQQIPGWHGKCTPGEAFPASDCNQKLIGAQWFDAGFGGDAKTKATFPYEYASARDADGHGSHTASTSAGNNGVEAIVDGIDLGAISGMAPRARIAAYKVCWGRGDEGGCFNTDSVAAIDQAVADGVDVINFSISGSTTSFADPVEIAFLFAADAGIVVSASAGNSGPTASTVAHNSPWLTTVAAGTHDRVYEKSVTLGNGVTYTGVGLGEAVGPAPLILATEAGLAGADADEVRLCYSSADTGTASVLDPAKVTGKIVVCDRGVTDRVHKSLAVKEAGGVGMVLVNTSANSLNADLHYVPTVHLQSTDRAAIYAYAAGGAGTATLSASTTIAGAIAPDVASFSSRGPALAGAGNLLKPDIMAPGNDILAAVSPAGYNGRSWDFLSGTSMSAPHLTGISALMKQAHPTWTPAMIKSALMTTASQTRNNGTPIAGGLFAYGAGEVAPDSAIDPGLVYASGWNEWLAFLCGTSSGVVSAATCSVLAGRGFSLDPSELNYPSIAVGALAGSKTITRTVTSVGSKTETYAASYEGLGGFSVALPGSFTLDPGAKKTFDVTFTRTSAALNAYTQGFLVLTGDKGHTVKSPVVLRPVALAAPAEVAATAGGTSYPITFGYDGTFSATARGLVPAATTDGTVADDPGNSFTPGGPGTVAIPVTIAAGTTHARFELFDADVLPGSDLDLYVYLGSTLVGASGGGTAAEQVDLRNPAAGAYTVYVHGWQTTGGAPSPFKLYTWLLGGTAAGNMTVTAPATATLGTTADIDLTFSGLAAGTKYLGSVAYGGSAGMPDPTIVRVDP